MRILSTVALLLLSVSCATTPTRMHAREAFVVPSVEEEGSGTPDEASDDVGLNATSKCSQEQGDSLTNCGHNRK
ncbi:MAG: hypothetical protein H7249_05170 [Chitinophagaceae bacterium]|nr:hypothetical protein [Oligoflexus sp.]